MGIFDKKKRANAFQSQQGKKPSILDRARAAANLTDGGAGWSNPNAGIKASNASLEAANARIRAMGGNAKGRLGNQAVRNSYLANNGPTKVNAPQMVKQSYDQARSNARKIAFSIPQSLPRFGANLAISAQEKATGNRRTFKPTTGLEKALFGLDDVTSYQQRNEGIKADLKNDTGLASRLPDRFQNSGIAAPVLGFGSLLLDVPGNPLKETGKGAAKGTIKQLTKNANPTVAESVIRSKNLPVHETQVRDVSFKLANAKNGKEVNAILNDAARTKSQLDGTAPAPTKSLDAAGLDKYNFKGQTTKGTKSAVKVDGAAKTIAKSKDPEEILNTLKAAGLNTNILSPADQAKLLDDLVNTSRKRDVKARVQRVVDESKSTEALLKYSDNGNMESLVKNVAGQSDAKQIKQLIPALAPNLTNKQSRALAKALAREKDPAKAQDLMNQAVEASQAAERSEAVADAFVKNAPGEAPIANTQAARADEFIKQETKGMPGPSAKPKKEAKQTDDEILAQLGVDKASYNSNARDLNFVERAALSSAGQIARYGKAGQELSKRMQNYLRASQYTAAQFMENQIPTVIALKGKEVKQFYNSIEALERGESPVMSPAVQKAVNEWTSTIGQVRQAALDQGMDVGDLGEFYLPRNYDKFLSKKKNVKALAERMVAEGKYGNVDEAVQDILAYKNRSLDKTYGHLEKTRKFDDPNYDRSHKALVDYVDGAFDRIAYAKYFGPKEEVAKSLIGNAGREFGPDVVPKLEQLFKVARGDSQLGGGPVSKTLSGVRKFNQIRSFQTSFIANAGQTVNTAAKRGIFKTAKDVAELVTSKDAQKFVRETGVASDAAINRAREGYGLTGRIASVAAAPLFGKVERFNRSLAALSGRNEVRNLAKKAAGGNKEAQRRLARYNIEGDVQGGKLTKEQELQAANDFNDKTQFRVDQANLPAWMATDGGKTVSQFKSFVYKQNKYIYDELLMEAKKGNPMPLMRFMAAGGVAGYGLGEARSFINGEGFNAKDPEDENKSWVQKGVQGLSNAGGFGSANDIKYWKQGADSNRLVETAAGMIGGPTAGFAVKTGVNIQKAQDGYSDPLKRQALRSTPFVGPVLANWKMPYKGSEKTTTSSGEKVEFKAPKDASDREKNQLQKEAIRKADLKSFEKSLNPDDRFLLSLSETDRKLALNDKTITEEEFQRSEALNKVKSRMTGSGYVDDPNLSPAANSQKKRTALVTDKAKEEFMKRPVADENSRAIQQEINKKRPKGVNEIKMTNRDVEEFAKIQKKFNENKDLTDIDKQKAVKTFWGDMVKHQRSQDVQDTYTLGSSVADYEGISDDMLKKAIELDNELYNAGLANLQFSKKFRNSLGFSLPSTYASRRAKEGEGDGSTKQKEVRIPGGTSRFFIGGGGTKIPTYSSRARNTSIKLDYAAPSNQRRIRLK